MAGWTYSGFETMILSELTVDVVVRAMVPMANM